MIVSYSMQEPEWPPVCECKYDEVHDRMDREDCPFHCDMVEEPEPADVLPAERKPPASVAGASHSPASALGTRNRGLGVKGKLGA